MQAFHQDISKIQESNVTRPVAEYKSRDTETTPHTEKKFDFPMNVVPIKEVCPKQIIRKVQTDVPCQS